MPQQKTSTAKKTRKTHKASDEQNLTRLIEEIIDKGADTSEEINRAILDLPVTILENLGLEGTAGGVKKVQDSSIGAIYKLIHEINHQVADLADDLLEQPRSKKR
jgi:uncharacterized protein YaaR (DUF327 family)